MLEHVNIILLANSIFTASFEKIAGSDIELSQLSKIALVSSLKMVIPDYPL